MNFKPISACEFYIANGHRKCHGLLISCVDMRQSIDFVREIFKEGKPHMWSAAVFENKAQEAAVL